VHDIESAIARRFPIERAEAWDRVGLLAGDPKREVTGVAFALDPTPAAIEQAVTAGANVLVTHHPAFLEPLGTVRPGTGPTGTVFAALDGGIALIAAHTNLDRDAAAQVLMPLRLGLTPERALETESMLRALVTAYVPQDAVELVRRAMTDAGAGDVGDYRDCSFASDGTATYRPGDRSTPHAGSAGQMSTVPESRVEMTCPRASADRVVAAAAAVHPYEEPLITATVIATARNASALGMVSTVAAGDTLTLETLGIRAAESYGVSPRVWGPPGRTVRRVATSTGSGGSLIDAARAAEVDVLVTGEVRYHDALDATNSGLALIELGHDTSEWPLVSLLVETVRSVEGLDEGHLHMIAESPRWNTISI
jgi:dinuclear metal center YbgI/SA1388 family protein